MEYLRGQALVFYPRVCGATRPHRRTERPAEGLSPRVRGHPIIIGALVAILGSIPACAGPPTRGRGLSRTRKVYPRVCGATGKGQCRPCRAAGLSPRVRGHHALGELRLLRARSIPACAGPPRVPRSRLKMAPVYPRVCGATGEGGSILDKQIGLSPRVRGHRREVFGCGHGERSIPACAGPPFRREGGRGIPRVYPRVCGATSEKCTEPSPKMGLSPRVRGHHVSTEDSPQRQRSIPACAGPPSSGSKV